MTLEDQVALFLMCTIPIYFTAFLIYVVRVIKGPSISDRVLAIDALSFDLAAFLVILGILFKTAILVPIAIVLALWVYALDIYVAKYLEAGEMGE